VSLRPIHALLALAVGALAMQGCYIVEQPGPVTNFLTAGDEKLATALRRAGAIWAMHGLEIANYVTVDDGPAGIPVLFTTAKELAQSCPDDRPVDQAGCTHWWMGDWMGMLIREDLADDPVTLSYIVLHEMVHALVPGAPHHGGKGVFTKQRISDVVTRADMEHLAQYTHVTESQVPFANEVPA
jgi:hypothetical protein